MPALRGQGARTSSRASAGKLSPLGSPILDGVLAWIDCTIETVHPGGDHVIVLGRVHDLEVAHDGGPLVFFRGGYGRFEV